MSTFRTTLERTALDAHKHVRYVRGMVLGVDEFEQEFAYLSGRDQWLARDTLGYGTLCGLGVRVSGTEVTVQSGTALTPQGQLVRVTSPQCARLDEWLTSGAAREAVEAATSSPPSPLTLYVVLSYRDCLTDSVPIPGEPCRSEDDAMAASRISDDFELELRHLAPDAREEDGVRAFASWLAGLEIGEGPSSELADVLEAARQVVPLPVGEGDSPPAPIASPPEALRVSVADPPHYLREAFRLWVTELRGAWRNAGADCAGLPPDEGGVLLAELQIPIESVDGGWRVADDVIVDESRRPYLLSLRMLQEMVLGSRDGGALAAVAPDAVPLVAGEPVVGGDLQGPLEDARTLALQGTPVGADRPAEGDVLTFRGGRWLPTAAAAATPAAPAAPAVTHDLGAAGFGIVAAGIVGLRGAHASPVYPDDLRLEARDALPGVVIVRFTGYENPHGQRFKYALKALPRADVDGELFTGGRLNPRAAVLLRSSAPTLVNFLGYDDDGIWLQMFQNGAPLDSVARVVLVVEVSRFPLGSGR